MGQRSQIYVKVDNELIIANYYQWNFAERMISRARYGIEHIKYSVDNEYFWMFRNASDILKLSRIFDVNFDFKDVAISIDIRKEYLEYGKDYCDNYEEYAFYNQDCNDGKLFIWIDTENKDIKYAFTDCSGDHPMTAVEYMVWEDETFTDGYKDRLKKSELKTFESNAKYIEKYATLMTSDDLAAFKNVSILTTKTA